MKKNSLKLSDPEELSRSQLYWIKFRDLLASKRLVLVALGLALIWVVVSYVVYKLEAGKTGANIASFEDGLWWGIVTFLTVGYGDRYPVTTEARLIAGILMFSGVAAIGIITAKISSEFLKDILLEGRGIVDKNKLKDHFIVCGWKEDMQNLLLHVFDSNPDLTPERLVLIANIQQTDIDDLRSTEELKGINIIVGDFFQQHILERANPKKARKVLILADKTPNANGQVPNDAEADARTIMTGITLSNVARGTLVIAELLDPKLDNYLKMAGVSEIIYSREYSRLLLGNASGGAGVSNVIYDLLDPKMPDHIATPEVPDKFIGKTYAEFKSSFEETHKKALLVGILENTGNVHRIREIALRDAQKTANVSHFIQNLQTVKQLRCNHPRFNPPGEYVIARGSAAIIIDGAEPTQGERRWFQPEDRAA